MHHGHQAPGIGITIAMQVQVVCTGNHPPSIVKPSRDARLHDRGASGERRA